MQPSVAPPAVKASPATCNVPKCPSTATPCCMESPDRNMNAEALGKKEEKKGEKKAALSQACDYDVEGYVEPPQKFSPPTCNMPNCPPGANSRICCRVDPLAAATKGREGEKAGLS